MTDSLMDTRAIKDLLMTVSGLDQDGGNLRVKHIAHRVLGDLFRTIEEFDVQPDEFWAAMSYRRGRIAGARPRCGAIARHAPGPGGTEGGDRRRHAAHH